jgi:hypothetical protein
VSEAAQEKDTKTIQDGLKSLMETIDEKPKTALANRENIFSLCSPARSATMPRIRTTMIYSTLISQASRAVDSP